MKINEIFLVKKYDSSVRFHNGKQTSSKVSHTSSTNLKGIADGQLIKGRVTGFAPDGKVYIEIAGEKLTARTEANVELENGKQIWLEVKQTGSTLVLAPANRKAIAQNLLRLLFSNSSQIADTLNTLSVEGDGLAGQLNKNDITGAIPCLLASAVKSEADVAKIVEFTSLLKSLPAETSSVRLEDVKAELRTFLSNNPRFGGVESNIEKLSNWLITQGSLNNQQLSSGQLPFLIFPCLFAMGNGWGEWMFSFDDNSGQEGSDAASRYNLDFFLELSRLGDLHVQLSVDEQSVFGMFMVEDKEVENHIKALLPKLNGFLSSLGFEKVDIGSRLTDKNLLHTFKTIVEEKAQLKRSNIVDLHT